MTHALAKELHAIGFRVFEVSRDTKRPALKGWQARAEKGDLSHWHGDSAVGIATGGPYPNGKYLVVVDIDNKPDQGRDGFASLAKLEAEHGALPHCPRVTTRSGGRHYYTWSTDNVSNSVGHIDAKGQTRGLGPGIDLRGQGGVIVAPGQMNYEWDDTSMSLVDFFRTGEQ